MRHKHRCCEIKINTSCLHVYCTGKYRRLLHSYRGLLHVYNVAVYLHNCCSSSETVIPLVSYEQSLHVDVRNKILWYFFRINYILNYCSNCHKGWKLSLLADYYYHVNTYYSLNLENQLLKRLLKDSYYCLFYMLTRPGYLNNRHVNSVNKDEKPTSKQLVRNFDINNTYSCNLFHKY